MISASDIVKLLDQIPVWKSLKALPARLAALEARVAALENTPPQPEHLLRCEICGKPAKVTNVRPHEVFDFAGRKVRTVTCEAGHEIEYDWQPGDD
jgi:hypothetical protein